MLTSVVSSESSATNSIKSQPLTAANFAAKSVKVLEPLLIDRDVVAQILLFINGFFGNLYKVSDAINIIVEFGTALLKLFPFGSMVSTMIKALFKLAMDPQTKVFFDFVIYEIWLILPANSTDQYNVTFDNHTTHVFDKFTNETVTPSII